MKGRKNLTIVLDIHEIRHDREMIASTSRKSLLIKLQSAPLSLAALLFLEYRASILIQEQSLRCLSTVHPKIE